MTHTDDSPAGAMIDDAPVPEPATVAPLDPGASVAPMSSLVELCGPFSDDEVAEGDTGEVVWRSAVLRGDAHRHFGQPCQDNVAVVALASGGIVVAVADGLGSCPMSRHGSAVAARAAASWASSGLNDPDAVIDAAVAELHTWAARHGVELGAFETTLSVVHLAPGEGGAAGWAAVVGDSPLFEIVTGGEGAGTLRPLTLLAEGPANVVPAHLPGRPDVEVFEVVIDAPNALLVCSDGIGVPCGDGSTPFARHLAVRWATPPSKWQFAVDASTRCVGAFDDRAAVAVWPTSPSAVEPA